MRSGKARQAAARLIVCERTAKWAVALRRSLRGGLPRVYETRSREECRAELQVSPASLIAVEATAGNLDDVLIWMADVQAQFPRCRVVVLASRGLEDHQWLLREAGAVHVVYSLRQVNEVVRIASRQLEAATPNDASLYDQVWDRLPW